MYISYQLFNPLVCGVDLAFNHELWGSVSLTSVDFSLIFPFLCHLHSLYS